MGNSKEIRTKNFFRISPFYHKQSIPPPLSLLFVYLFRYKNRSCGNELYIAEHILRGTFFILSFFFNDIRFLFFYFLKWSSSEYSTGAGAPEWSFSDTHRINKEKSPGRLPRSSFDYYNAMRWNFFSLLPKKQA